MKVLMLLAQSAQPHPDGTFSLLGGGINRLNVAPNTPSFSQGSLVARIEGSSAESGQHSYRICCVNEDGAIVGLDFSGNFAIQPNGSGTNLIINVNMVFPKLGAYTFNLAVDKQEVASWKLDAVEHKLDKKG